MEKLHPTKKHIMDIALKLFSKKGFDKTTITEIITKTKISKGAVYHHFKSKEEIAHSAIEIIWEKLEVKCDAIMHEDISAILKLRKMMQAEEHLMEGKETALYSIITNSRDLKIRKYIQEESHKKFLPMMTEIIKQGKKEGVFKINDPLLTTYFLLSLQESMFLLPPSYLQDPKNIKLYTMEYMSAMSKLLGITVKQLTG